VDAKIVEINGWLSAMEEHVKREIASTFDDLSYARDITKVNDGATEAVLEAEAACAEAADDLRENIRDLREKLLPAFEHAAGEIFAHGETKMLDSNLAALEDVLTRGQNLLALPAKGN